MNKEEYKKLAYKARTKTLNLPSGLTITIVAPLPAEITDAMLKNNIDIMEIQEIGKRTDPKTGMLNPKDAHNPVILRFTQVIAAMIKDTDGERPIDYLIGEDYQAFVAAATDFFTNLPTVTQPHTVQQSF
jgi:hypothetical protein